MMHGGGVDVHTAATRGPPMRAIVSFGRLSGTVGECWTVVGKACDHAARRDGHGRTENVRE